MRWKVRGYEGNPWIFIIRYQQHRDFAVSVKNKSGLVAAQKKKESRTAVSDTQRRGRGGIIWGRHNIVLVK